MSPGDRTRHQIDFVMIKQSYQNSITQCKTYPGADVGSDHNPVIARMKVKLKKPEMKTNKPSLGKIPASAFKDNYMVEVKNRYEVLAEEDCTLTIPIEESITKDYNRLRDSIISADKEVKYEKPKNKKPWITQEILDQMAERKKKKNTPEYRALNKKIQRNCEKAHETWLEERCEEIEENSRLGQARLMHEGIKNITGKKRANKPSLSIKDKNGKLLHDKDKILDRWKEYIGELFDNNRPGMPTVSNAEELQREHSKR